MVQGSKWTNSTISRLKFYKCVLDYYNFDVSKTVLKKLRGHLWYLSDEALGLHFLITIYQSILKRRWLKLQFQTMALMEQLKNYQLNPMKWHPYSHEGFKSFCNKN